VPLALTRSIAVSWSVIASRIGEKKPALAVFKAREMKGRVYYPARQRAHDDAVETIAFA